MMAGKIKIVITVSSTLALLVVVVAEVVVVVVPYHPRVIRLYWTPMSYNIYFGPCIAPSYCLCCVVVSLLLQC